MSYEKYEDIIVDGWLLTDILEKGGVIITDINGEEADEYVVYIDSGFLITSKIPKGGDK
jgi:hypothetical protein